MTILLVEDEAQIRTIAATVLRRDGHEVLEAADGDQALFLLKEGVSIRALITGIRMPGADGWAVARAYREQFPDLPVLYATGFYDEMLAVPRGVILEKPYRPSRLVLAVRELLGSPDGL